MEDVNKAVKELETEEAEGKAGETPPPSQEEKVEESQTEESPKEKVEEGKEEVSPSLPLREERAEEILLNNFLPLLSLEEGQEKKGEVVNRENLLSWLKSLKDEKLSPYFRETYRKGKRIATAIPFSVEVKGLSDYSPSEEGKYLSKMGERQYRKALALASLLSPYGRQFGLWDRLSEFYTIVNERLRELSLLEGEEEQSREVRELEEELSAIRVVLQRREELLSSFKEKMKELKEKLYLLFEFPEELKEMEKSADKASIKRLEEIEENLKSLFYQEEVEKGLKKGRSFEEDFPLLSEHLESEPKVLNLAKELWEGVYAPVVKKLMEEGEGFATSILSSLFVEELSLKVWLLEKGIEKKELFLKIPLKSKETEKVKEELKEEKKVEEVVNSLSVLIREIFYPTYAPRNFFGNTVSKLFNLEVLLTRIFEREIPDLNEEELNSLLGGDETETAKALRKLKKAVEREREEQEREKVYPLFSSDYLTLLKEVGAVRLIAKTLKEETPATEKLAELLKEKGGNGLIKRALVGGLLAYAHSFAPTRSSFLTCVKQASLPPDREFNVRVSSRYKECLEKFISEIQRKSEVWLSKAQEIASPSPLNPFKAPFSILYAYLGVLRRMEGAYWNANKVKFVREISEKGTEIVSLPPEKADEKLKEIAYQVVGLSATVKEEGDLSPFEARGIFSTTREVNRLLSLEGEEFFKELLSSPFREKFEKELEFAKEVSLEEKKKVELKIKRELEKEKGRTFVSLLSPSRKVLVFEINEEKVREMGGGEKLEELFKTKNTEKFLSFFGLSQELLMQALEEGKIRNGMEFSQIWKQVSLSVSYLAAEKDRKRIQREFLPEV